MGSNDITKKWVDIYNEVDSAEPQEAQDNPWEYDDYYPETATAAGPSMAPPIGMPSPEDYAHAGPSAMYTQEAEAPAEDRGSWWENMKAWVWNRAEETGQVAFGIGRELEATGQPIKAAVSRMPEYWGNPLSDDKGEIWKKIAYAGFQAPVDYLRRTIGWTKEMGVAEPLRKMGAGGLQDPLAYLWLQEGTYAARVEEMLGASGAGRVAETPSEIAIEVQDAQEYQAAFDDAYQGYLERGYGANRAAKAAAADASVSRLEKMDTTQVFDPEASTVENPFGATQDSTAAWQEAEGYRYSHSFRPDMARKYETLRDAGYSPKDAAAASTDPAAELAMELILDPNWIVPLDNLIISAALDVVKAPANLVGKAMGKVPILKGGLQWAGELTAKTKGNFAARHADDAIRYARGYLDDLGQEASAAALKEVLTNPPPQLLDTAPAYYRRAVAGAAEYADEIGRALDGALDDAAFDLASKQAAEELGRAAKAVSADDIAIRASDIMYDQAISSASTAAYRGAIEAWAEAHPVAAKWAKPSNPVAAAAKSALNSYRGIMVDTWLGLRPSWNVFNYVDNTVKLLLDGVNPFSSVADLSHRYSAYSPETLEVLDSIDEMRSIKFWDTSVDANTRYVELMHRVAPKQALGTFGEHISEETAKSGLKQVPGLKQAIEWNTSLSSRIEMSMRARAYYKHFFDVLDSGWYSLSSRNISAVVDGAEASVSPAVAKAVRQRLTSMQNPTPASVSRVFQDVLDSGKLKVVVSELGGELGETYKSIPKPVISQVQQALNELTELGPEGPGVVTRQQINEVFDEAAEGIVKEYNNRVRAGVAAFDDTLPRMPESGEDLYNIILPSGDAATLEEIFVAIDDMPQVANRMKLESTRLSNEHWAEVARMKQQDMTPQAIAAHQDAFLLNDRPMMWRKFNDAQEEAFTRMADRADELLGEAGQFPRQYLEQYMDAARVLTDMETEKYRMWRSTMQQLYSGDLDRLARDELFNATRFEATGLYEDLQPRAKDDIHRALVGIREWFISEGQGLHEFVDLSAASRGVNWWRVEQQIDNIPISARKQLAPALDELDDWWAQVLTKRSAPFTESAISGADRAVLRAYGQQMVNETAELVSSATDNAVTKTNDLLFDYETTQNWMSYLGKVFPFVRFPSKNIPLWAEKMAEIPHLSGSVHTIRELQAEMNKDLPSRHKYSVPLPFSAEVCEALGFHNTTLRINPWSFISMFQQLPGATEFSRRELEELSLTREDRDMKDNFNVLSTVAQQMGFGTWPYLEWMLGMQGWLGDDWYPRDALGTWTPLIRWAMQDVFKKEVPYGGVDRFMRTTGTQVWNSAFGDTPLAWEQLNPDLFREWVTGREMEGLIMQLPSPVATQLATNLTPVEVQEQVRMLKEGETLDELGNVITYEDVQQLVMPVFATDNEEEQVRLVEAMGEPELAVLMAEMEKVALRTAIRKQALTTFLGNTVGLYANPVGASEVEARNLRTERRMENESLEPGQERRDHMKQWYTEHPKYELISDYRFAQHPWAETAAGKEAELWDAVVNDYESQYWDYNAQWRAQKEIRLNEVYRERPGDKNALAAVHDEFREQKAAKAAALNEALNAELERRITAYIQQYPNDIEGIKALREGWETNVYVAVTLSQDERNELRQYKSDFPQDSAGYRDLYLKLYDAAMKRQPPTQKKKVPGLDEGIQMDVRFNPASSANYSETELADFIVGDVFDELKAGRPDKEDFEHSDDWWLAYNNYLESMPTLALETETGKAQIQALVNRQGLPIAEAKEIVASWYTKEEMYQRYRTNDTIMEALENAYRYVYIAEAEDLWYNEVKPLRDSDYDLYQLMKTDLEIRFGGIQADELIRYVMEDYPGRWTAAELEREFAGIEMPGYFEQMTLNSTGSRAVTQHINRVYYALDADTRRTVREAFGPSFSDTFLSGRPDDVSVSLRGRWLDELNQMTGQEGSWTDLPGVGDELLSLKKDEVLESGLPVVAPRDEEEFAQAMEINRQVQQARVAGEEHPALENHPLYVKWFGSASAKGMFWNTYYDAIPPGGVSYELRKNAIIASILDKDARNVVATNSDYDAATSLLEGWLQENQEALVSLGLNQEEYQQVRDLYSQYYEIPEENKDERKAFKEANPLLKKYMDAKLGESSTSSGYGSSGRRYGGGSGGGGSRAAADSQGAWTEFRAKVGQSFHAAVRMLAYYWQGGEIPPAAATYLKRLHGEIGGDLSFEEWLEALRVGWQQLGTKGSSSRRFADEPEAPPEPRYYTGSRGIRRG